MSSTIHNKNNKSNSNTNSGTGLAEFAALDVGAPTRNNVSVPSSTTAALIEKSTPFSQTSPTTRSPPPQKQNLSRSNTTNSFSAGNSPQANKALVRQRSNNQLENNNNTRRESFRSNKSQNTNNTAAKSHNERENNEQHDDNDDENIYCCSIGNFYNWIASCLIDWSCIDHSTDSFIVTLRKMTATLIGIVGGFTLLPAPIYYSYLASTSSFPFHNEDETRRAIIGLAIVLYLNCLFVCIPLFMYL